MNQILIALVVSALLCGSLRAQAPQPTSTPPKIAPGSVIPVHLVKSIDAKKAKTGDEVIAKVTQDLRNGTGTIVLPRDTKIVGHITEAQARTKDQKHSEVGLVFDHAILNNGALIQMSTSIQAIIAAPNRDPAANNEASSYPGAQPGGASTAPASRQAPMEGPPPATTIPQTAASGPDAPARTSAQPRMTADTQGVTGIKNLTLSSVPEVPPGTISVSVSVLSSEKNNVKLEDGTYLLLRVNQ
jgi:hypothetical protein